MTFQINAPVVADAQYYHFRAHKRGFDFDKSINIYLHF